MPHPDLNCGCCGKPFHVADEDLVPRSDVSQNDVRCPHCNEMCEVHAAEGGGTRLIYGLRRKGGEA